MLRCLADGWPGDYPPTRAMSRLQERLSGARFNLAVLGQLNRGKSTFINALLGADVVPAAVLPLTAIPTFLAWGAEPRLRVSYLADRTPDEFEFASSGSVRDKLWLFVTEEHNPANARGVAWAEVFLPADILRDGVVLIDTPGIGSTFRHNTHTALQVLPECDAALFVVSADPPITEAEIAYLAKIRPHVVQLFFVLNKIDYLEKSEQVQFEIFLREVLGSIGLSGSEPEIFLLSARQALAAKLRGDVAAVEASGLARIEREIVRYLAREKAGSLKVSVQLKARDLVDQALADLALRMRALELPLAELERRSAEFAMTLRAVHEERRAAQDLLAGDRARATAKLEAQAGLLRQEAGAHIARIVKPAAGESGIDEPRLRHDVAEAVTAFFDAKLADMQTVFRHDVESMLAVHQTRADALGASVRRSAADLFNVPFKAATTAELFRLDHEPYWVTREPPQAMISISVSLLVRVLPAGLRAGRLRRRVEEESLALVLRNVENLRWATLRSVNETFRRFAAHLDAELAQTLALTQGVLEATLERRRSQAGQTGAELTRLATLRQALQNCRSALVKPAEAP